MSGAATAADDRPEGWRGWASIEHALGVDLGQRADPSTAILIERRVPLIPNSRSPWLPAVAGDPEYRIRHAERLPLNLSYPAVAEHVMALVRRPPLNGDCDTILDASGLGKPVLDSLRRAGLERLTGVVITGGSEATRDRADKGIWYVPKFELVSRFQVAMSERSLKVAAELPAAEALRQELGAFEVRYSESGRLGFEAGSGRDDLVLGAMLALWHLARPRRAVGMATLYGT